MEFPSRARATLKKRGLPVVWRGLLAALIAGFFCCGFGVGAAIGGSSNSELLIGAREDAKPFVWFTENSKNPNGFLWDLCALAVQRADYVPIPVPIDPKNRIKFLEGKSTANKIDLLCDPTTITLKRIEKFPNQPVDNRLSFSQILFVANGTSATNQLAKEGSGWGPISDNLLKKHPVNSSGNAPNPQLCKALLSNAAAGKKPEKKEPWIQLVPNQQEDNKSLFEIWGYVSGTTMEGNLPGLKIPKGLKGKTICHQSFSNYRDAAKAFCSGHIARYFGDEDIIRHSIGLFSGTSKYCEESPVYGASGIPDTYEPYALVIRSGAEHPQLSEQLTKALYEIFAEGTYERLFLAHFPNRKMSNYLKTLVRINQIPRGQ